MKYLPNTIYHCFNQGNNRQKIFFTRENYLFFLQKMSTHLLPCADLLAYCLMPNHFHWLLQINEFGIENTSSQNPNIKKSGNIFQQRISQAIATLLRSYTRAINKQEDRSGSLFRHRTKSKDGQQGFSEFVTVDGKYRKFFFKDGLEYARTCFQYIHENPFEAGLVERPEDWEFSSARDYAGLRNGTLCNQNLAKELGLF